jgi:hypothetical protein
VDLKFVDTLELVKPDAKRKRPEQKRDKETGHDKDGEALSGQLKGSGSLTGHMFPGGKGTGADPTEGKLTQSTFPEDGNAHLLTYTDRSAPLRFSDPITPDELRHSSKGYYSAFASSSSSSEEPSKATEAEFVSWKKQLIKRWMKQGQVTLDVRRLNRAEIPIDSEWFERTRACDCDWKTFVSKLKTKELTMLETPLVSTSPLLLFRQFPEILMFVRHVNAASRLMSHHPTIADSTAYECMNILVENPQYVPADAASLTNMGIL